MTEPQNGEKVTTTIEAPESVAVEIPVRTGPCTLDTIVIGQTGVQLDGVIANGGFNVIRRALEPTEGGCKILHVVKHPIKQRHIPPKEARREFKRRREELRRESLARARLKGHENIVAMGGYKRGLLLLEPLLYAEGWRPLSDYLGADDPSLTNSDLENLKINPAPQLKPADIIQIAMGVVGGVKTINEAGLIHCDIKPDNIMIGRTENEGYLVKFIDFGSVLFEREDDHPAKNSDGKTVVTCSVPYASIEQLRDTFKIDNITSNFAIDKSIRTSIPLPYASKSSLAKTSTSRQFPIFRTVKARPLQNWYCASHTRDNPHRNRRTCSKDGIRLVHGNSYTLCISFHSRGIICSARGLRLRISSSLYCTSKSRYFL